MAAYRKISLDVSNLRKPRMVETKREKTIKESKWLLNIFSLLNQSIGVDGDEKIQETGNVDECGAVIKCG